VRPGARRADDLPRRPQRHRPPQPGGDRLHERLHGVRLSHGPSLAGPPRPEARDVNRARLYTAGACGALLALGCRPALDDRPWLVTAPAILGWKAEPPEAPPGAEVTLELIALDPIGGAGTAASWRLCPTPPRLDEN